MPDSNNELSFVKWFRSTSPYIHAHRGRTFVITFGGEAVASAEFADLIHDIALLNSLGVRLILVHGARPQIEQRLALQQAHMEIVDGLRITDDAALRCVKDAAGSVRVEIEALLSMGVSNSPMAGARVRVTSGNFVTAKPIGVRNGIDYCHTGTVRQIDSTAIRQQLDSGAIVLLPSLGYSPTGEVFNLSAAETAASVAIAIKADKLVSLVEAKPSDSIPSSLLPAEAEKLLNAQNPGDDFLNHLKGGIEATRHGVERCHLIHRSLDGGLLTELFTRDGCGTLITSEPYENLRPAKIDDVAGILELLEPLEKEGILVRRSREMLETEINYFHVLDRDGMIVGCASLYPYTDEHMGELACVAIHADYQGGQRGEKLLAHLEIIARQQSISQLFILTTHTSQWFQEKGFVVADLEQLPETRRKFYNYQRNSRIYIKNL